MGSRIDYMKHSPALLKKLVDLGTAGKEGPLGLTILDLVNIRASQLNGCAFCLDMHSKEAKIHGERELRLYHVAVWRESPLFSAKEKACLDWTETVTQLNGHGIPDEAFERVREHLSGEELSQLTFAIGAINFFNRLNVASPVQPGSMDEVFGLTKAGLK
jgi:AhpD family alkylhydroperoxidase